MKRILSASIAALLVGSAALGASAHPTHAATPAAHANAMMAGMYGSTLLAPQGAAKVTGAIALTSDGKGGMIISTIVAGLQPFSKHEGHIHMGMCSMGEKGKEVVSLPDLLANNQGEAMAVADVSTLKGVPMGGAMGLYFNTHQSAMNSPILACGNIQRPTAVVTGSGASGVKFIDLMNEPATILSKGGSVPARGTQVIVTATGLKPFTANPIHIHGGPCGTFAPVVYPLGDLVAAPQGRSIQGAGVGDLVPLGGLSIHAHNTSYQMTACGNIGGAMTQTGM